MISEDNNTAWRVLANFSSDLQNLLRITACDYQSVILRTVVAGICSNVPELLLQNLTLIIDALSQTIGINHRTVLNSITSKLPLNGATPPQIEVLDEEMNEESEADASTRRLKEDLPSELDQEVKMIGYLLSAQRISAEVLSNICTPEDDQTNEEVDDNSDPESVHDYDLNQQVNGNKLVADKIPLEIAEGIKAHQIVEKVNF